MGGGITPNNATKTVVVLGAAYGGARAAQIIATGLPPDWKLILVDRNSHANHVYVMPRYAVLPGHEYKAFIPYTNVFLTGAKTNPNHTVLKAHVLSLRPNHVTLSQAFPELGIPSTTIPFDYCVYALGARLPAPLDLWGKGPNEPSSNGAENGTCKEQWNYNGFKTEGVKWFKEKQSVVQSISTVLVVGGGGLGIQFATDIKAIYPEKKVTLLHSREQLLPRFDKAVHDEVKKSMDLLEVELILGERLDLSSIDPETRTAKVINAKGQRVVRTDKGREISADLLLLCTGQKPNSSLLAAMDPATVNPDNGLARVQRTMQLTTAPSSKGSVTKEVLTSAVAAGLDISASSSKEGESGDSSAPKADTKPSVVYPHIFAIGDAADAFGAIAAGHNAYAQGEIAGRNVLKLVSRGLNNDGAADLRRPDSEGLEQYTPRAPAIKVSLGLTKSVYQVGSSVGIKTDGQPDLQAALIWPFYGMKVEKDEDMLP